MHVSLRGGVVDGGISNVANGVSAWEEDWPKVCALFGLRGVGPRQGVVTGKEWVMANEDHWATWVRKLG